MAENFSARVCLTRTNVHVVLWEFIGRVTGRWKRHTCASCLPDELVDDLLADVYAQVEEHSLQLVCVDRSVLVLVEHQERCFQFWSNKQTKSRLKNYENIYFTNIYQRQATKPQVCAKYCNIVYLSMCMNKIVIHADQHKNLKYKGKQINNMPTDSNRHNSISNIF